MYIVLCVTRTRSLLQCVVVVLAGNGQSPPSGPDQAGYGVPAGCEGYHRGEDPAESQGKERGRSSAAPISIYPSVAIPEDTRHLLAAVMLHFVHLFSNSQIQKMVISGGDFKPDALKPKEMVSLLLDDEEMETRCEQHRMSGLH